MHLEIVLITYNRAGYLKKTLEYLSESSIRNVKITVLDNSSRDETLSVCKEFKNVLPDFLVISHRNNIGLGANIIRALEISLSTYTWVLCDDDILDLSHFEDVRLIIEQGEVDLIHVGGHPQKSWPFGGKIHGLKSLYSLGYPYFKFASFLPSNIFRTKLFQENFLIEGYNNVINAYPHMPYLLALYNQDKNIYVSKYQMVFAKMSGQSYDIANQWFFWWMKTCELLVDKYNARNAFLDQWKDISNTEDKGGLDAFHNFMNRHKEDDYVKHFLEKYFTQQDKKYFSELDKAQNSRNKQSIKHMVYKLVQKVKEKYKK